jgi:NAD(P)-dependent dehydrogenase (short-subunit alcohol dehydrogenase family)
MATLRAGLLDGVQITTHECGEVLVSQLVALGATVVRLGGVGGVGGAGEAGVPDAIVCDVDSLDALDEAWPVIQGVVADSMIPAGPLPDGATRKVLLIGPRPGGTGASSSEPARAALENLARTLSVEWARFSIVAAMVAPGSGTTDEEIATLAAFLCSSAGHYYSGCRFSLRGVTKPS